MSLSTYNSIFTKHRDCKNYDKDFFVETMENGVYKVEIAILRDPRNIMSDVLLSQVLNRNKCRPAVDSSVVLI